jgi:hypothetical protein
MRDLMRTRWAAVGAAVAVTLGAGGVSLTQAALTSGDKPVYVALDAPCRLVDTRPGSTIGPKNTPIAAGETNAYEIQVTGANGDCTGPLAIPAGAVAVATNVTAIAPVATTTGRSFFTVYPADATLPTTSNLNFVNGQAPVPNKVDVGLSADGKIKIYNNEGTAHAAVDIFGYYIDHNHDDRYYTKAEVNAATAGAVVGYNRTATVLNDATVRRVSSTSIRVPADGYLVLQASGTYASNGAGTDQAFCQLTKGPTRSSLNVIGANNEPWTALTDFGTSGAVLNGFSVHNVVPVSRADNPLLFTTGQAIGLDCLRISGTVTVDDVVVSATFVPENYAPSGFVFPFPILPLP